MFRVNHYKFPGSRDEFYVKRCQHKFVSIFRSCVLIGYSVIAQTVTLFFCTINIKRAAKCRTAIICSTCQAVANYLQIFLKQTDNTNNTWFNNIFISLYKFHHYHRHLARKSFIYGSIRLIPPTILPSPPQIHDLEAWEEYYRGLERTIPTGIEKSTGAHPFGAGLLNFRCLRPVRFMGTRRNATRSSVEFHGISIRIHPLFYPVKFEGNERNEAANESRWERWRSWLIPLAKIDWLAFLDVLRPAIVAIDEEYCRASLSECS